MTIHPHRKYLTPTMDEISRSLMVGYTYANTSLFTSSLLAKTDKFIYVGGGGEWSTRLKCYPDLSA
ncbi:hypothetical protein LLB_1004 [Legionella longbeachae D-4968]|nr:hypothetical protein LLB_1004 [Legionella longbeachae D-4968]